ncbi:hypothetical protein H2203_004625 [Taxawa tesnikishii (nom. ined.)]|nr:hypothetical protein H2203_004625 [Dothideales sp. JES 119]
MAPFVDHTEAVPVACGRQPILLSTNPAMVSHRGPDTPLDWTNVPFASYAFDDVGYIQEPSSCNIACGSESDNSTTRAAATIQRDGVSSSAGRPSELDTTDSSDSAGSMRRARTEVSQCASKNGNHRCDITGCTYTRPFKRLDDLKRHRRTRHGAGDKVFRCLATGCTYQNFREDKMREHVRRPHVCQEVAEYAVRLAA